MNRRTHQWNSIENIEENIEVYIGKDMRNGSSYTYPQSVSQAASLAGNLEVSIHFTDYQSRTGKMAS